MITIDKKNFDELYPDEIYDLDDVLETALKNGVKDTASIKTAYEFAKQMHSGQKRESGQSYIVHPLNVAFILAQLGCDKETIIAGFLHDVLEDTEMTYEKLSKIFGEEIAELVNGVTNLTNTYFSSKEDKDDANLKKIFISAKNDIRIIFIKLADRLHNMRTLEYKSNVEKQRLKAIETIDIYAPLAKKLGIYRICTELEDLSLKYIAPYQYKQITNDVDEYVLRCQKIINDMQANLDGLLRNENIDCIVKTRIRNIYSIFRKKKQRNDFSYDKMHDLIALKIIIDDVNGTYNGLDAMKCYSVLGFVHSFYKPFNNGGIKDYIANPKFNMYSSLHTTVFGEEGKLIQAQIRTIYMSKIASFGLPAYFNLNNINTMEARQEKVARDIKNPINAIGESTDNNREFINQFIKEALSDSVYVYAKDGKTYGLPQGSTAIDFAYYLHTEIGKKMVGVLVNGQDAPLNYILQPHDHICILTSENALPLGLEYIDEVRTDKAKMNIKKLNNKKNG